MQQQDITQWQQAMTLYRDVLELPDAERATHISKLNIEPGIQHKLKQLMQSAPSENADPMQARLDRMIHSMGGTAGADVEAVNAAMIGRRIGDWQIIEPLGHGGMASVYVAERSDVEFEQRGALKLLSLLMLATGGSQRFVREQQFLAQLHHPNIAMLLDGGVADDGTPYLVTELVDGSHIRDYCRQQNLGVRDSVLLLLQVCAAVSHAHGHLILHRDIKPSNVMVTAEGQVKLVDFGIGKLAQEAADGTQSRIFTPKYAAPEQLTGEAVTTATDIYGLGMLGRTLLAEQLPEHNELGRVFHKATHEDHARRYGSVEGLTRDLHNWLENRPVTAVDDSLGYRVRKYLRRHRGAVAAGSAFLLAAAIGVTAIVWQANAARIEAQKATTLADFMTELFAGGDLLSGEGPDTPIASLMQTGAERARTELQQAPEARAEVLRVIGLAQTEFGQYEQAGINLQAALDSTSEPLDRARVLGSMGVWAAESNEFAQGIEWMQQALDIMSPRLPVHHPDRLEVEINLINFLLFTAEYQQSLERADRLMAAIGNLQTLPDIDQANLLRSRAMALTQVDRIDEAIGHLHQAIDLAGNLQPPRPALVAAYLNDLGNAQYYAGDQAAAMAAFTRSYRTQVDIYGAAHKRTITTGSNLVHMLRAAGQLQQAQALGHEVLDVSLDEYGQTHRSVVLSRFALALALSDAGQHAQASQQMTASIAALRQLDDMRRDLPGQLAWHGEILIRQGQFAQAIDLLEEAENIYQQEMPDEQRRYRVAAQRRLTQAHAALGQCASAQHYFSGIEQDLAGGNQDDSLATQIYLLNCQSGSNEAAADYRQSAQSARQRDTLSAGLRAALHWADQQFG